MNCFVIFVSVHRRSGCMLTKVYTELQISSIQKVRCIKTRFLYWNHYCWIFEGFSSWFILIFAFCKSNLFKYKFCLETCVKRRKFLLMIGVGLGSDSQNSKLSYSNDLREKNSLKRKKILKHVMLYD